MKYETIINKEDFYTYINNIESRLDNRAVFLGFDAYIDEILTVVKKRYNKLDYDAFNTIQEFIDYLRSFEKNSFDIELITTEVRPGGNSAIMANSLSRLGIKTYCLATFGIEKINNVFNKMHQNCTKINIGQPAYTHAFEFSNGKLMFGNTSSLNNLDWESIKKTVGLETVIKKAEQCDLIAFLNWSSIVDMNNIIEGFINDVFKEMNQQVAEKKKCFFDISDPSKRSWDDLSTLIDKLGKLSAYVEVILGLNEKEARILGRFLNNSNTDKPIDDIAVSIAKTFPVCELIVHGKNNSISIMDSKIYRVSGINLGKPRISTGGGDNFNAGFCMGKLLELPSQACLITANAVASYYVRNGYSPNIKQIETYIKNHIENISIERGLINE